MSNEFTTPLTGTLAYRNAAIIKAVGPYGEKISVGKIEYQHFDDESFQYIISPFWDIVDGLPANLFAGIPGIKMEMRLPSYFRVNYEPVFITERTPAKNREDLWELLESVGLDYYDRLEWLIRTPLRAANDNLIVERLRDSKEIIDFDYATTDLKRLQYGDEVIVDNLQNFGGTPGRLSQTLAEILFAGADIRVKADDKVYAKSERSTLIPFVIAEYYATRRERKSLQRKGIAVARSNGKYKGRPKATIDDAKFAEAFKQFRAKQISLVEAMAMSGIASRSTFYRRVKEI